MRPVIPLPGLERMFQVCRTHGIELYQEPPGSFTPGAGSLVAGLPCDPLLAAVHARVGDLGFPKGCFLFSSQDFTSQNEEWRREWPEPFRDLLVFGKEQALAYYYATVPTLAGEGRIQPVVKVDTYEDLVAIPIASSVDRFFDAYSRFLERHVQLLREDAETKARREAEFGPPPPGSLSEFLAQETPNIVFPWEVPDVIARDEPLVKLLRAGRFDFLMGGSRDIHAWVGKVLAAANT